MKITKKTRLLAAPLLFHDTVTGVTIRTAIPDGGLPYRFGTPLRLTGEVIRQGGGGVDGIDAFEWEAGGYGSIIGFQGSADGKTGSLVVNAPEFVEPGTYQLKLWVNTRTADDRAGDRGCFTIEAVKS